MFELEGATLIVTRPRESAAMLARSATRRGARVVRLPGTALRARGDAAVIAALRVADRADAVIFVSPAAVRFAWKALPTLCFARKTCIAAVGAGTAKALHRQGVETVAIPEGAQDSAGLLAEPVFRGIGGQSIALVGAPGGRDLLVPTLRRRGAHVTRIDVYERTTPRWTRRHFDALAKASRPWILLVSSGEALSHIAAALPEALASAIRRADCVVSSPRLAALAEQLGFLHIHVARSALSEDLLAGAAAALAHHRL